MHAGLNARPARGTTARRLLFDSDLLQIGHVAVHPATSALGEPEVSERHVLALTVAGAFALHDGPRQPVLATPNHALLICARQPYRLSFPGAIGDRCLVLRFSDDALARALPEHAHGDGLHPSRFAAHALLTPAAMLERNGLLHRLARGEADPLDAQETGIRLLDAALQASRLPTTAAHSGRRCAPNPTRRLRPVRIALEAVATQPTHPWTLDELARHASVSPGHLAHAFRAVTGTTVHQYVMRSRLAVALEAVLDSDAGLSEVAMEAGFSSHSHLTARFRAFFGRTPQALRRDAPRALARQLRRNATAARFATA